MAAQQDSFDQLLTSLLSSDNDARSAAEKTYGELPIETKTSFLVATIQNAAQEDDKRQIAAVLLRRIFTCDFVELFNKLPPANQTELKTCLLTLLQSELSDSLRKKICDLVSELARNLVDEGGTNIWTEFLTFLFQCASANSEVLQESALRMFASFPGVFNNQDVAYFGLIEQMFQQSLVSSSYPVRFQAVKALSAFIMTLDIIHIPTFFSELPLVLQVIAESVDKGDDDALLKCLIDLAERAPKFLIPQRTNIFHFCLKVMSSEVQSWRNLGLEAVVTMCESGPAMLRNTMFGQYIPMVIPLILTLMTDLDDEPGWSVSDEIVEYDNDSNNVVAESALDRLACGLGGKTVLPQVMSNVSPMLANPNWKYRHAALMAISAIGEGCAKQMEPMLEQIMGGILNFLKDPHPRVRYAVCNAIGQMSTDFSTTFEKKFHPQVIPGLLMVLGDDQIPRVQAHAGAALVNFIEDCPTTILLQYLEQIIGKLEQILSEKLEELVEKGTKLVLEQVVTLIASVADTSREQFVAYYDRIMPRLKWIIHNTNKPELKMLRGKTIECVSFIGLAVGQEKFIADATDVMDLLLKTHVEGDLPDNDPQTSYLISASARICNILGKQFEQYLPLVIYPVMRTASLNPEVAFMDNEDMDEVSGDKWKFVSLAGRNFGIRTAGIEDKAFACDKLVCYAKELKEGFAEYAEPVVKLMVPMLKYYFHDGVRTAAAKSLPCLLECAKVKGADFLIGMWQFICPELLKAIEREPETEVKHEHMYSMANCIKTLGKGCMTEEWMQELIRILNATLEQHLERALHRLQIREDEDHDEVVEEQSDDEYNDDDYTLIKVADILNALFVTYKEDFYSYFDLLLNHLVKMVGNTQRCSDRLWGLRVFLDVIEYGGPACVKYQQYFLRPIIEGVSDKHSTIRQLAAYGCGTLAMNGGATFAGTQKRCCQQVHSQEASVYAEGLKKLVQRYEKCLEVNGDYVEK